MGIEFTVGEKYRNRRGEYEVLEILHEGRMKVRYVLDGSVADLDQGQQARIIDNMQVEVAAQAQLAANVKPPKTTRTRASAKTPAGTTATPKVAAPTKAATSAASKKSESGRTNHEALPAVELRPLGTIRTEFTKLEVLKLLQNIGFGNLDGQFWFVGNSELAYTDGNAILSERVANPEFQKEFTDAAVYKRRFKTETTSFYGSPIWQYANYLVTRLLLPPEHQLEEARRDYFTKRFGALDGDVLLTDIMGLPARSSNPAHWPYRNCTITDSPLYNTVLSDAQRFMDDQLMGRAARIKRLNELYEGLKVQKSAPKYIFCFGRSNWRYFKEIFPNVLTYTELEFQSQPDKDRIVRSALARDEDSGTLIVLLPVLNPQEGISYYYLDQLLLPLLKLSSKGEE